MTGIFIFEMFHSSLLPVFKNQFDSQAVHLQSVVEKYVCLT
jgi:hypothetical protein